MSQDFEEFASHFIQPQTPKEAHAFYAALASRYRQLLAEAPANKFVISLCTDQPEPYFLCYSGSFGYYRGTLVNAIQFIPPIRVNLAQLGLKPEHIETFDLVLYRLAAIKCVEYTDRVLSSLKETFPDDL